MNFRGFVVLFSVLGICALYGISMLSQPADVQIGKIGGYEGMYVKARGTITDLQIMKYGSASMKLRNNTSYIQIFVESYEGNVSAGDEVEVSGRVEQYRGEYEIAVLNDRAVKMLKKWDEEILFVSQLAQEPEKYEGTNVKLIGKVDKVYTRSFYIGDESGTLSLKVVANNTSAIKNGDSAAVSGRFTYDPKKAQYYLDLEAWNKTFEFEEEFLSVQQIAQSPKEYRNSSVTVTGYVSKIPDEINAFYLKDEAGKYSIKTISNNTSELVEGNEIVASCLFVYEPTNISYYLDMRNRSIEYDSAVTVSIQQLVKHPHSFKEKYVNVIGEVGEVGKKEVFYLKDKTNDYSLRITTNTTSGLFKGDTINASGRFVYDHDKLEYYVSLKSWKTSDISFDRNVSLQQLSLDPERYEGTNVTLVGYVDIDRRTTKFFYLNETGDKTSEYSLRVNGTIDAHEGSKIKINGTFLFDSENLRYQLDIQSFEDANYAR
jgi:DNA/RNA endonuclease YhcR with UshA esterase domain